MMSSDVRGACSGQGGVSGDVVGKVGAGLGGLRGDTLGDGKRQIELAGRKSP